MLMYSREEMIGITELAKSLSGFVGKLKTNTIDKIAIMKNNVPEAVIVPVDKYEKLAKMEKLIEQISIANAINKRVPNGNFKGGFDYDSYRKKRLEDTSNVSS